MGNVDLPERREENPKTYAAFHIREHRHDRIFSTENGEEFLDTAFLLSSYLQQDAAEVRKDFSQFFYNSTDITRKPFEALSILRMENTGQVAGAFEIDLDDSPSELTGGSQKLPMEAVSLAESDGRTLPPANRTGTRSSQSVAASRA